MTTTEAQFPIDALTKKAQRYIHADTEARAELATAAASGRLLDTFVITPALTAQAVALPWRLLVTLHEAGYDFPTALVNIRAKLTSQLVERGEGSSSSAIVNETGRLEREGIRKFLMDTEKYV